MTTRWKLRNVWLVNLCSLHPTKLLPISSSHLKVFNSYSRLYTIYNWLKFSYYERRGTLQLAFGNRHLCGRRRDRKSDTSRVGWSFSYVLFCAWADMYKFYIQGYTWFKHYSTVWRLIQPSEMLRLDDLGLSTQAKLHKVRLQRNGIPFLSW